MNKYRVGEDLKQGEGCVILDGVVHRVESEYCECERSFYANQPAKYYCGNCEKPIAQEGVKPKRELPEKFDEVLTTNYVNLKNKINEIIDYLKDL